MAVQSFFSTYVEHSKNVAPLKLNKDLKIEIFQLRKMDIEGQIWCEENNYTGYTSYGTMDQLHQSSPNFAELEKIISQFVTKFVRVSEWDIKPKDLRMNSCWANVMPMKAHHSFHIHPHSVLSGTYYVDVPKGSSPLKFEDPRHGLMMLAPQRKTNCQPRNKSFVSISSNSRDLILFESWLRHEVPPNRSEKERISISFNYSV